MAASVVKNIDDVQTYSVYTIYDVSFECKIGRTLFYSLTPLQTVPVAGLQLVKSEKEYFFVILYEKYSFTCTRVLGQPKGKLYGNKTVSRYWAILVNHTVYKCVIK